MGVDPGAVLTRELIHPDDRAMRERVLAGAVDDGGFDPTRTEAVADTHGFGLTCMHERLQAIGGRFTLRGAPGAGPRIRAQAAARAPA